RRGDRIEVRFPGGKPASDYAPLLERAWASAVLFKPEMLEILDLPELRRRAVVSAALLREGLFLSEPTVCGFFIGHLGESHCKRCGAPLIEHLAPQEGAR
ncbi:MAG: hypothetical protein KGM44_08935, partial [bacterium]|nr:hypothetical protein [bacterium]